MKKRSTVQQVQHYTILSYIIIYIKELKTFKRFIKCCTVLHSCFYSATFSTPVQQSATGLFLFN